MDEAVLRSMARWPNVPAVFGWLRLDRRGVWWVKNAASDAFERITNRAIIDFIGRNYASDEQGRWFFQNGPQRVFVALEYAPLVIRIADDALSLVSHNDWPIVPTRVWLDEGGALLMSTDRGAGILLDRDLAAFLDLLVDVEGHVLEGERISAAAFCGDPVRWRTHTFELGTIDASAAPHQLGFERDPQPHSGNVAGE